MQLFVRQFNHNNCSIEFDALGFSVKDIQTRCVMLRCYSEDDLYTFTPATTSSTPQAYLAIISTT